MTGNFITASRIDSSSLVHSAQQEAQTQMAQAREMLAQNNGTQTQGSNQKADAPNNLYLYIGPYRPKPSHAPDIIDVKQVNSQAGGNSFGSQSLAQNATVERPATALRT